MLHVIRLWKYNMYGLHRRPRATLTELYHSDSCQGSPTIMSHVIWSWNIISFFTFSKFVLNIY